MYFIDIKAFIEMEETMRNGGQVDGQTEVLEYRDDESKTEYAILSHRWTDQEVSFVDINGLAEMEERDRNRIRQRGGYQKILSSCRQADADGYAWLWIDTCCIDKRSSAELSEAINSMYRWYESSAVCYAHLHDVDGSSFPAKNDTSRFKFNGWPEWFSRGWTLQEMIAPNDVRFFNKDWQPMGDKKIHARTLAGITGVSERVLAEGFASNRPCIAQIMSWAANRTTTRVEDRAYSLLGLLDVNMPMLYGEGKKAFHRLQVEIIRMSDDQSIFAWNFSGENGRAGSILADDPKFFYDCSRMELMSPDEFYEWLKSELPEDLHLVDKDRFGVYPITNRGILIWLLLRPCRGSDSVFKAWLPCRSDNSSDSPVALNLAVWGSKYYRYFIPRPLRFLRDLPPHFHQIYLGYQGMPHHDTTFEIDDSEIIANDLTCCGVIPSQLTVKSHSLTTNDPPCVIAYSDKQTNRNFAVGFGQCFGQIWVHVYEGHTDASIGRPPWEYALEAYNGMVIKGPEHARTMAEARSGGKRLCVMKSRLPESAWVLRISCIILERSRRCKIKLEVFQDSGSLNGRFNWIGFDVEVNKFILSCPNDIKLFDRSMSLTATFGVS